jgi:hypothetical protein
LAGIQIGQLLVKQGVLTPRQVDHILEVQRASHRPFGDLAERLYGISPEAIEDAWVQQYVSSVGATDLAIVPVDPDCLHLLNRRQAWQFALLPLHRSDGHLHMATDAEHLIRAVNVTTRRIAEPICFLITDPQQLRTVLMKHYPVPAHMADYAQTL